jgi:hypothetical protein
MTMNDDNLKQAWRGQPSGARLTIDADLLLKEVQRNERYFAAMIFWRDVREVGTSLVLIPVWFYLGARNGSPWTYYLTVPVLLWVAGFLLADRMRHNPRPPEPGEPLRRRVAASLAQVNHQIWLLRNVLWWAILPLAVAMLAFLGQVALQERAGGWWMALAFSLVVGLGAGVLGGVYGLNLYAIRAELEPRRRELATLLQSLEDETPDAP